MRVAAVELDREAGPELEELPPGDDTELQFGRGRNRRIISGFARTKVN